MDRKSIEELENLRKEFGENLEKPIPKDFKLTDSVIEEIENIIAYNQKIGSSLLYIFHSHKKHKLIFNYIEYKEKIKKYPSEEKLKYLLEKEKELIEKRKKADYWFSLDGFEFEEEVAKLFEKTGLLTNVVKTKGTGDGGIDIVLINNDGSKIFIQCKAHKKPVGPHVARDLFGVMTANNVKMGIIISLGGFSSATRDFMKGKNIRALDVDSIIKMQEKLNSII